MRSATSSNHNANSSVVNFGQVPLCAVAVAVDVVLYQMLEGQRTHTNYPIDLED
jgi:hypothetical protein